MAIGSTDRNILIMTYSEDQVYIRFYAYVLHGASGRADMSHQ
jgi:hypothetical protein